MLTISVVQTNLIWEDVDANLTQLELNINSQIIQTDIIVLPEMFTTGFTMNPEQFAEPINGKGFTWMQKMAKQKKCAIVGSISVIDAANFYNRLYWVNQDGSFYQYDKKHLFSMGNEPSHYSAGNQKIMIDYLGWKICPLICYDLRFPIWSRNTKNNTYDVLIYVANWPAVRTYPWQQLLIARAIENQSFVIGVNRIGEDGNGISHTGNSVIINPRGEIISDVTPNENCIKTYTIYKKELNEFRIVFPVLNDGDDFQIM